MHLGVDSPVVDVFLRGGVPREARLLAARGLASTRGDERLAILALMAGDQDTVVAELATSTLADLPAEALAKYLTRADVPAELRDWFVLRGFTETSSAGAPLTPTTAQHVTHDRGGDAAPVVAAATDPPAEPEHPLLSSLPVPEKVRLAMLGRREQRAILIRDPNRMVASAVLSSPKLTDTEIEHFARMQNVSEEVLRVIGTHRTWTKNYAVAAALVKNSRTPPSVSMALLPRLQEREIKSLAVDRNIPESVRLAARKYLQVQEARRS
ncbi:MAG: hypothetical protein H0V80_15225 [Acidobacteria bacterium]|nr:hypothetical protein [Acidobacteriota bacterium]